MYKICLFLTLSFFLHSSFGQKPRVLISTDIGGTDPDDNQSMTHLMMYSDLFQLEGLVSSPSYGKGTKEEILRMIDLYEKDFPTLKKHYKNLTPPKDLRRITKQGRKGAAPYVGYSQATEGSNWIIQSAMKPSKEKLWVLVWGGLEDLAQALHNQPKIQDHIRVYWIGGPNKKWSANAYAYIAQNFPDLWMIENNASYYGFFSKSEFIDQIDETDYYEKHIAKAGSLGEDFKNYYQGKVKMGDTPSLLYLMNGNPNRPEEESWGGSFEKIQRSARVNFERLSSKSDTVAFCTMVNFTFKGPEIQVPKDSVVFWMLTPYSGGAQKWAGYYLGNGTYGLHYVPKQAELVSYEMISNVPGFPVGKGQLVVTNQWPGKAHQTDYILGSNWYSDKKDPNLYDGKIQGGKTVSKWRKEVMSDWAKRWSVLK